MNRHSFARQFLPGLVLVLLFLGPTTAAPPSVNGKVESIGPFRVLRVWGTPEEMGFAHGYLAGERYVAAAEEYLGHEALCEREKRNRTFRAAVRIPDRARAEIEGMFQGIVAAAGGPPHLPCVDRPLELEDLLLDNAGDLVRAFACSGFTVWGKKAGEAGVITARNFDYLIGGPVGLAQQMILVRRPEGRNQVATVTWPGYLGAFTGINEHGVCTFLHDGNGRMSRTAEGSYTPVALALKDLLETARPADAHRVAETLLGQVSPYPFSYLVRVVTGRVPGTSHRPARVFRIDAAGMGENPGSRLACITTNHYLDPGRMHSASASNSSLTRYRTLAKGMRDTVSATTAWESLRAVAPAPHREHGTLHSLVVYPEHRELDLAFATWRDSVVPAPAAEPVRISFDDLFARHD